MFFKIALLFFCTIPHVTSTISMVTVWGTPVSTLTVTSTTTPWVDCVSSCYSDTNCYLAHGRSSDDYCALYVGGAVGSVLNEKDSPTGNMVSFKMSGIDQCPSQQEDCFGASMSLGGDANGKYSIVYSAESYTFSYQCSSSGDWKQSEGAVCNSPCATPMLSFTSYSWTPASNLISGAYLNITKDECGLICWLDANCFSALWADTSCTTVSYGLQLFTINLNSNANAPKQVFLKIYFDSETCSIPMYNSLLDANTFALPASTGYTSVTTKVQDGYGVYFTFKKTTPSCSDVASFVIDGIDGCYHVFMEFVDGMDYITALSQCQSSGGDHLMMVPNTESVPIMQAAMTNSQQPGATVGFVGLTRTDANSPWVWAMSPQSTDAIPWGDGQPGTGNCATMGVTAATTLTSIDCSSKVAGFVCHLPA